MSILTYKKRRLNLAQGIRIQISLKITDFKLHRLMLYIIYPQGMFGMSVIPKHVPWGQNNIFWQRVPVPCQKTLLLNGQFKTLCILDSLTALFTAWHFNCVIQQTSLGQIWVTLEICRLSIDVWSQFNQYVVTQQHFTGQSLGKNIWKSWGSRLAFLRSC